MNWRITIIKYKKASREIPKEHRRYSIAVGYIKKWETMWQEITWTRKEFTFDWGCTDDKMIRDYANIAWVKYFKGQPKQILIYLGDELKFGKDNLDKFYFS